MKNYLKLCSVIALAVAICPLIASAQEEIKSSFTADKVILPSSQYTPSDPYTANVWVFNENRRYDEAHKNHIWATPPTDENGNEWYKPEYQPTNGGGADWQMATAPFSSDEYYKDKKSFRWALVDITAELYMRRSFTLNSLTAGTVYLACGHDDAPSEWYINGTLVHSVDDGWNNDEYYLLTDEQKALLKTDGSENVLAVHVHQNYGGAFADCGLYEAKMTKANTFLSTVADGEWPCKYYMLNYNDDIAVAESAEWYALDEDEDDWMTGVGPFSNDNNMFYTTEWASQVKPILIRRHFTLDAADFASIDEMTVRLTCSYDENPKVWLNGTQIWSAGGWNDNNYADYILSDEHRALLREGDNVLCVSLAQGGGGGHIDYGLIAEMPYDIPTSGVSSAVVAKTADNRVFNLFGQYMGESIENLSPGIYIVGGKKVVINK